MRDLPQIVDRMEQALSPWLDRPFAFFGHSMGGLLAFELGRRLRRTNAPMPFHFFASARSAPQLTPVEPPTYALPDKEFIAELKRLDGIDPAVLADPELVQLILPWIRADFEMTQTYRYVSEAPLPCPITVFGGIQDKAIPRDRLEAWKEQTESQFVLRMLPGGHFFIDTCEETLVAAVEQQICRDLNAGAAHAGRSI